MKVALGCACCLRGQGDQEALAGRELFRLEGVEIEDSPSQFRSRRGTLILHELRVLWSASRPLQGRALGGQARATGDHGCGRPPHGCVSIGYGQIAEAECSTTQQGKQLLSLALRPVGDVAQAGYKFSCGEDEASLAQALAAVEGAKQAYDWARRYLQCTLRQHDLFVHGSGSPELQMLPLEQVIEVWENVLNYGAKDAEDLVGRLTLTNCRVVWALDKDRATYNVSVPHRAYVPSLAETQTFGLCLVLTVASNFVHDADYANGVRLGFGLQKTKLEGIEWNGETPTTGTEQSAEERANPKHADGRVQLKAIFSRIKATQVRYAANPQYGVADYVANRSRYQVDARVRILQSISHWDVVSEDTLPTRELERQLVGEVCECAICLEQVCNSPPQAYLLATGRIGRACSHFFHMNCLQELAQKRCPICRATFSEARELPDIRSDPGAWFDAMDSDRTGSLSREEVLGALSLVLPIDRDKLEALLGQPCGEVNDEGARAALGDDSQAAHPGGDGRGKYYCGRRLGVDAIPGSDGQCGPHGGPQCASCLRLQRARAQADEKGASSPSGGEGSLWRQWDKTGRGSISRKEFEDPEGGLLVWILGRLKLLHRKRQEPPELAKAATAELLGAWFDFWDWGQVGFLTRVQIMRACVREHEGQLDPAAVRAVVEEVWNEFSYPPEVDDGDAADVDRQVKPASSSRSLTEAPRSDGDGASTPRGRGRDAKDRGAWLRQMSPEAIARAAGLRRQGSSRSQDSARDGHQRGRCGPGGEAEEGAPAGGSASPSRTRSRSSHPVPDPLNLLHGFCAHGEFAGAADAEGDCLGARLRERLRLAGESATWQRKLSKAEASDGQPYDFNFAGVQPSGECPPEVGLFSVAPPSAGPWSRPRRPEPHAGAGAAACRGGLRGPRGPRCCRAAPPPKSLGDLPAGPDEPSI